MQLFRGFDSYFIDGEYQNPFIENPRTPRDTDTRVHNIADKWFEDHFSITARSSTIFCSTSRAQAEEYCEPGNSLALIEPIGNYKIIYSKNLTDFTEYRAEFNNKASPKEIMEWLKKQNYQCLQDFQDIYPHFTGELMLFCKSYKLTNLVKCK